MKKTYIIFILLIINFTNFSQIAFSQDINNMSEDTNSVNLLFEAYKRNTSINFDSALIYSSKALEIAQKINNNYLISKSYLKIGNVYINKGEYKLALKNFEKAELFANKSENNKTELSLVILDRISWTFLKMSNYETAIEYANKSLEIDSINNASAYSTLATIYIRLADYLKATNYYFIAEEIYEGQNNLSGIASIYNNLAKVYVFQNDFETALKYLIKSASLYEKLENKEIKILNTYNNIGAVYYKLKMNDTSEFYYEKALNIAQKLNYSDGIVTAINNLTEIKIDEKNYNEAYSYLEKTQKISALLNDKNILIESYFTYARLYYAQNKLDSSLKYLFFAYDTAKKYNHHEQKNFALQHIAIVYANKGDYKNAYLFQNNFFALNDSIFNINKTELIEQLKFSFETEKNLNRIENLKKEKKYQSIIIKNQKKILLIIIISLIIIIIFSTFITRQLVNKNNAYKQLVRKNEELLNMDEELNIHLKNKTIIVKKGISDEKKIELLEKIKTLMLTKKTFLNSNFSLAQLSQDMKTNRAYLSKVINENLNMNFPNFVNEYRIKESCRLISNKKYESETIQSISEDAGFNSPSAFINAFKKFTGVTPSFYIKEIKNKTNL